MYNLNNWYALGLALLTFGALVAATYQAAKIDPLMPISSLIMAAAKRYPILPMQVGMLLGHLFWSQGP